MPPFAVKLSVVALQLLSAHRAPPAVTVPFSTPYANERVCVCVCVCVCVWMVGGKRKEEVHLVLNAQQRRPWARTAAR